MKRILAGVLLGLLLIALTLPACSSSPPAGTSTPAATSAKTQPAATAAQVSAEQWGGLKFIRMADSSAGDPAMEMWGVVCTYWSQIPGIQSNVFAASSGTQIFMISDGTAEAGVIYGSQIVRYREAKYLPQGKTKPVTNVSAIYTWSNLAGAIFVRADSKFKTFEDLKTASIGGNVGEGGFGGTVLALLEGAGITQKNIGQTGGKISTITTAGAQDGLRDKTLDAWLYGGTPVTISEAATVLDKEIPLRMIRPSAEIVTKANQLHPEFGITTLDWTGGLQSEKGSFQTLGDFMMIAVPTAMSNDLVYQMIKQINETDCLSKIRRLGASHAVRWPDNSRVGADIWGEHPGAVKYYEEKKIPINKNFLVKSQ
jgi:TRAP transporter TAXI family solute receptor